MEELDASQLGKLARLVHGAETIVDSSCRKDGSRTNRASDKLVVLAGEGGQVGRIENRHGEVRKGEGRRCEVLSAFLEVERIYILSTSWGRISQPDLSGESAENPFVA